MEKPPGGAVTTRSSCNLAGPRRNTLATNPPVGASGPPPPRNGETTSAEWSTASARKCGCSTTGPSIEVRLSRCRCRPGRLRGGCTSLRVATVPCGSSEDPIAGQPGPANTPPPVLDSEPRSLAPPLVASRPQPQDAPPTVEQAAELPVEADVPADDGSPLILRMSHTVVTDHCFPTDSDTTLTTADTHRTPTFPPTPDWEAGPTPSAPLSISQEPWAEAGNEWMDAESSFHVIYRD